MEAILLSSLKNNHSNAHFTNMKAKEAVKSYDCLVGLLYELTLLKKKAFDCIKENFILYH